MRIRLPRGSAVRSPRVAGATYATAAAAFAAVFIGVVARSWLRGPGVVPLAVLVVVTVFVAATAVWRVAVPRAEPLSVRRAAGAGAGVALLAHALVGPAMVVTNRVVWFLAYRLADLGVGYFQQITVDGGGPELTAYLFVEALLYSLLGFLGTLGVPTLLAAGLGVWLASRQEIDGGDSGGER